jgi:deoxyhypusine synthase
VDGGNAQAACLPEFDAAAGCLEAGSLRNPVTFPVTRADDDDLALPFEVRREWAAKNNIPVFVPGITDGSVGYQLWFFSQDHKDFRINLLKDEDDLNNIVFDAKQTGALIVGGGISKHHVIWWNQFKDGLDYVIYISTADEWDGSLSGARPREAVSWGKISEKARRIMIEGDATMVMPIMTSALIDRLSKKKKR